MVQYETSTQRPDESTVSERVFTAVADARDEDPLELPPLYDVIDPDALDQLFDHGVTGRQTGPGRVNFRLADCEVVVHSDGEVEVTAAEKQIPASSADIPEQDEAETSLN